MRWLLRPICWVLPSGHRWDRARDVCTRCGLTKEELEAGWG